MSKIAVAFLKSARVSRAELYGVAPDRQLPANLIEDAHIPFLGFAGPRFQTGGVILLAINPGGGGDAYTCRRPQDNVLLPLIEMFVKSTEREAEKCFAAMSTNYASQVKTWNLWRILNPVLDACRQDLSEVAYLNCFPYRTAGDRKPDAYALRASWNKVIEPLLAELKPSTVIALGKKAGSVMERHYRSPARLYVVPRTIGDTRVSDEAHQVLEALRREVN